jgi:hypothetical protein
MRARTALASDAVRAVREAYLRRPWDIPDFLAPAPLTAMPTIEEELAVLRATPADRSMPNCGRIRKS